MDMRYAELIVPMLVQERQRGAARYHLVAQLDRTKAPRNGGRAWHRLVERLATRPAGARALPAAGC